MWFVDVAWNLSSFSHPEITQNYMDIIYGLKVWYYLISSRHEAFTSHLKCLVAYSLIHKMKT